MPLDSASLANFEADNGLTRTRLRPHDGRPQEHRMHHAVLGLAGSCASR